MRVCGGQYEVDEVPGRWQKLGDGCVHCKLKATEMECKTTLTNLKYQMIVVEFLN